MLNIKVLVIVGVLAAAAAGTVFVVFQRHEDPLAGEMLKRMDAKEQEETAGRQRVLDAEMRDAAQMRRNAGLR